jgi:hypothetical protein
LAESGLPGPVAVILPEDLFDEVTEAPVDLPRPKVHAGPRAEDLDRLAARRQGEEGGGRTDCRLVSSPTAVTIMQRKGPGRTQVRLTDAPDHLGRIRS